MYNYILYDYYYYDYDYPICHADFPENNHYIILW